MSRFLVIHILVLGCFGLSPEFFWQAGCRTIEHCSWIAKAGQWGCVDEDTVQDMARGGVAVAPTAHANWRHKPMGQRNYERAPFIDLLLRLF